jgi:peptidoglycan/xylan/chitin deacetylase (PgdA/CDA1 family)
MKIKITALLIASAVALGLQPHASASAAVNVPILMYHEVKYTKLGKDAISPWELESDLVYLRDNGYTPVTVGTLIDYVTGDGELPDKPVVLSFDDGYLNNHKFALPLLRRYNVPVSLSLIVKNTDDFSLDPSTSIDYAHMTWEQVREMAVNCRAEITNHTYAMHGWGHGRNGCTQKRGEDDASYTDALTRDVTQAQSRIREMTGATPRVFVYPYGKYSDLTDSVLKSLGIEATLTCDYGVNVVEKGNPECLYNLKRVCRSHGVGAGKLLRAVGS